jgi:excisionase family DNA binding protein
VVTGKSVLWDEAEFKKLLEWAKKLDQMVERFSGDMPDQVLLTSKQIAPYLGVLHPKTVERWVREKGLPCVRIGRNLRFRVGDVLRWRAQRKEG